MADSKTSEKERTAQLKALRRELEAQMEADLHAASLRGSNPNEAEAISAGLLRRPALSGGTPRNDESVSPKRVVEALLFASGKPLTINEIQKVLSASPLTLPSSPLGGEGKGEGGIPSTLPRREIECLIGELKEEYTREGRSFELIEIAGGWEIVTQKEYATWLTRLELQKKIRQASRSALETLSILAYKQPVTRAEIEEIRGVDISGVLTTLLERGFVKIVGKKEVPGRPFLYGTTEKFLEHFGLKSIKDLPPIGEIKTLVERAVRKEEIIGESQGPPAEN